jgi:predicted AlkP superfamily phosphohydrolase/phosphomutase
LHIARALGLALSWLLLLACGDAPARRGRALVIGIDGAEPRIVRPMLKQGRLPHLGAIASVGVFAPLRAHAPISSPRIWTSMATGKLPEKHGIVGFAYPRDGEQHLYTSADRRVHALWNIASDAGLTVAVVNWWSTYPPEKVNGVLVSDHLLAMDVDGRRRMTGAETPTAGSIAWPVAWHARATALLAEQAPLTDAPDPFAERTAFPGWARPERLSLRYDNDLDVARVVLEIEAELRPDLMMVFFPGIDRISHQLWASVAPPEAYKYPPAMTPEQRAHTAEALRRYYVFTDSLIGRLLEAYGPDDLVLVVSDHGFEPATGLGFLTGGHHSARSIDGVLFARGAGVGIPQTQAPRRISVNDIAPTVLAWLGLPIGDDMDGAPAPFLLDVEPLRIASHDTRPIERLGAGPSGAEEELLEQLRALGYVEDADSD